MGPLQARGDMKSRSQVAIPAALVGVTLLLGSKTFSPAQPAADAAAGSTPAYAAKLEYQEISEALVTRAVPVQSEPSHFRKEPKLSGKDALRGLLQWGHSSESPIPFLWDKAQGRLYLDLNRNRDLTDDPNGIADCGTNGLVQVFTNISLPRVTPAGVHPVKVLLGFRSYQPSSVNVSAGLCCLWQARVSLRGQDWQFGLVENALEPSNAVTPAYLLLRPWAARERPFNLNTASPDFANYSTNLFFGHQAYCLACRYDTQGAAPCYQAVLTEQSVPMGELKVIGAFLHRLILIGDKGLVAILDQPEGTRKIPAGGYAVEEIWLRQGDLEAARFKAGRLTVDPRRLASLTAGGPLTNSVKVVSQGYDLSLRHELLGVDGQAYRLPRPDYKNPPQFALFQGTNRLVTGKFQFG